MITGAGRWRLARTLILALLIGVGVNHVVYAIRDWPLGDMDVYLEAARRLRHGRPLYVAGDVAVNSYWYAPWYAAAWVPFTFLPREVVAVAWSAVLLAATAAVALLLWRMRGTGALLALMVAPALFAVSAGGNVQALMVLALLLGFHRSWGPIAVGVAASMKLAPLLLAAAYLARGEWLRALLSVAVAAVLYAPAVVMGITNVQVRSDAAPSLLGVSPVLYVAVVVPALLATALVPRRLAALAAAAASVLALPRLFAYDVTLVATGAASEKRQSQ